MSSEDDVASEIRGLLDRVQILEDEMKILDVLSRFSMCADGNALDDFVELFTADVQWHYPAYDGDILGGLVGGLSQLHMFRGPQEIRKVLLEGPTNTGMLHRVQHHARGGPCVVEIAGDQAVVYSYYSAVAVMDVDDLRPSLDKHSFTIWYLKRVDDEWKICAHERRRLGSDGQRALVDMFPIVGEPRRVGSVNTPSMTDTI